MSKPTASPDPVVRFTLDDLHSRLGDPAHLTAADFVDASTEGAFAALGEKIGSQRILSDTPRIVGTALAFLEMPEHHEIDVTREVLAFTVQQALKLRGMSTGHVDAKAADATKQASLDATLASALEAGLALQKKTTTLLKSLAAKDAKLNREVDAATSEIHSPEDRAKNLEAQATLLVTFLAHKKDAVANRVKAYGATPSRVEKLKTQASAIRDAAVAASGKSVTKVGQSTIDLQDGLVLHLLGELIHAFEAAHGENAAVPLLVPISTRKIFDSHHRAKASPVAGPSGGASAPTASAAGDGGAK